METTFNVSRCPNRGRDILVKKIVGIIVLCLLSSGCTSIRARQYTIKETIQQKDTPRGEIKEQEVEVQILEFSGYGVDGEAKFSNGAEIKKKSTIRIPDMFPPLKYQQ